MQQAMFVTAARIAAHLYFATKIAQNLSLTAKNARAITARAGQQAAGFTALTAFIQELADNTINLAKQVNRHAVSISTCSTQLERVQHARRQFSRATDLGNDAMYIRSISSQVKLSVETEQTLLRDFASLQYMLVELVAETRKQIRFAAVISTMSKVEASKSGSFEQQLDVIAANILQAGDDIKQELECAESLLSETMW